MAIPSNVYHSFFTMGFIHSLVKQNKIYLIIYNIEREAIAQWQM
ncbi:element excision factor XisH family protein [Phormidium nigroviride]